MPTVRARRAADPKLITHGTRLPRPAAILTPVPAHEGNETTVIDVCSIGSMPDAAPAQRPGLASLSALIEETETSIRQLSDLDAPRPPQDSIDALAGAALRVGRPLPARALLPGLPAPARPVPPPSPRPAPPEAVEATQPAAALCLAPGGRVGKYELREKLGMGTFGLVFVARDTDLDRDVALKVLNPTHVTNRDIVQRFLQEARASARIQHPGIVTVFDCARVPAPTGETAFITMELLAGESLTSRLNRSGRLAPELACEIARQVASALDAAHRADVLHRDLKPDNIYLVPDPAVPSGERVKVLDFGLAKLGRNGHTMSNTIFGTPRYMSPEQCRSASQIDQRSDIYALGCILFELLTGRTPFDGDLRQLIERHQRATPPRARNFAPEISEALDDLIDSMLAKDPAARPQTMGALQRQLQALGAVSVGVATTLLPMIAQAVALAPGHAHAPQQPPPHVAYGSAPRPFDASDAEIILPAPRPSSPRNPALMLPPEGRRGRSRTVLVAAAVGFVVAALLTALATNEPAMADTATPAVPQRAVAPAS